MFGFGEGGGFSLNPFEQIPGLLTPEMERNTDRRAMLNVAAGLLQGAGPSQTKWGGLYSGISNAVKGIGEAYDTGSDRALKQVMLREQIAKAQDDRQKRMMWAALMGGVGPAAGGAAPGGVPGPGSAMPGPGGAPGVPGAPMAAGGGAGPIEIPGEAGVADRGLTQREVQAASGGGFRDLIATVPAGVRQLWGVAGPDKGLEAALTWAGKKAEKPSDTFVTIEMPDGKRQSLRADDPVVDRLVGAGGLKIGEIPAEKKPDNFLIQSNGETILSHDGKTYERADGTKARLPRDAIRLGPDTATTSARTAKVEANAKNALATDPGTGARPDAGVPSMKGTGPWSNLKAAIDSTAGAGVDHQFFPANSANRTYLNNLRQMSKTALVNNPRFPVAEQENVDKLLPDTNAFWTNSQAEAGKIPILRNYLRENLRSSNEAIASGALSEGELSKFQQNVIETKRALRLFGEGDTSLNSLTQKEGAREGAASKTLGKVLDGAQEKVDAQVKPPKTLQDISIGETVRQNGKLFQKQPDGSMKRVPDSTPLGLQKRSGTDTLRSAFAADEGGFRQRRQTDDIFTILDALRR